MDNVISSCLGNQSLLVRYNIGKLIAAAMEETEIYLVRINVRMNTAKTKGIILLKSPITAPSIVATPLPPLKPAKTGKACPTTTTMATDKE